MKRMLCLKMPPPFEEESNHDEESIDEDAPIQLSQVTPYNLIMSFGHQVIWHWNKHKQCIKHKYAIVGWAVCVMEDVQKGVQEQLTGMHCRIHSSAMLLPCCFC
jgi:hypothetical protein